MGAFHATDLDVLVEVVGAHSDGENGNRFCTQGQQLVGNRCAGVVAAIAKHDEAGEGQRLHFASRALDRVAEARLVVREAEHGRIVRDRDV